MSQARIRAEGKQKYSRDAHSGCRDTHGLEGAWGVALEAYGISGANVGYRWAESLGRQVS